MCECWKRCRICVYDFNGFHMRKTFILSRVSHEKLFSFEKNNNNPQVFHLFPLFFKKKRLQQEQEEISFFYYFNCIFTFSQQHFSFFYHHKNAAAAAAPFLIYIYFLIFFSFLSVSRTLAHTKSFLLFRG
ncbi:hypothetical protein ACKWTF_005415 [Chironomus riparius]